MKKWLFNIKSRKSGFLLRLSDVFVLSDEKASKKVFIFKTDKNKWTILY